MKMRTKRTLTNDEINAVVVNTFGSRPQRVEEFHGGMMSSVYRVDLAGRESMVLKVGSPPSTPLLSYEANALRTEAFFYEKVDNVVPLPKLIAKDLTREVIDCDYMFIEMFKGKPWAEVADEISECDASRIRRELGRCIGNLHSIQGTRFGYTQPGTPSGTTWREAFWAMLDAILEDTITWNIPVPISQDAIRSGIDAASWALHDVKAPCLLHFDLWPANIFLTNGQDGDWSLEGIIDCERSYYGDPLAELVSLNWEDPHDEPFMEGYAQTAAQPFDLTPSAEVRLAMYMVYLTLIRGSQAAPHGWLEGAEREAICQFYAEFFKRIPTLIETCRQSA